MGEISGEVRDLFTPGNKVRLHISDGNPNNKLMHILAIVDGDYVVDKVWSQRKQGWYYHVDHLYLYELFNQRGHITKAK